MHLESWGKDRIAKNFMVKKRVNAIVHFSFSKFKYIMQLELF